MVAPAVGSGQGTMGAVPINQLPMASPRIQYCMTMINFYISKLISDTLLQRAMCIEQTATEMPGTSTF